MIAPLPMLAYRLCRMRTGVLYKRAFSNATLSLGLRCGVRGVPADPKASRRADAGVGYSRAGLDRSCDRMRVDRLGHQLRPAAGRHSNGGPGDTDPGPVRHEDTITADLLEISLAVSLTLVVAINPLLMALALPSVVLCRHYLMRAQQRPRCGSTRHRPAEPAHLAARGRVRVLPGPATSTPLAVAMVDIDDFGSVQETVGDEVAVQSAAMSRPCSLSSSVSRTLSASSVPGIRDRVPGHERRRRPADQRAHAGPDRRRVHRDRVRRPGRVRVPADGSIGVAVMNETRRALNELIGAADTALDQAKGTGWKRSASRVEPAGGGG